MNKIKKVFIIYPAALFLLVFIGIIWWQNDLACIKGLEYQKKSQYLSRYKNRYSRELLNELRESIEGHFMYIVDERRVDNTKYELIGYSQPYWLFSGFVHKVTIVGLPQFDPGSNSLPVITDVYVGHKSGGALPFLSIAVFSFLAIGAIFIRKENLPHIFEDEK